MANTTIPVELSSTPGIVDNSNATAITIDSSENVGIGTGSPIDKLHVAGNSSTRNTIVSNVTLDGGTAVANPYTNFGFGIDFIGLDYGDAVRNYAGIYTIMDSHTSSAGGGDAGFKAGLSFYTNGGGASDTNPTERLRIDSSGKLLVGSTANLGTALLNVAGGIDVSDSDYPYLKLKLASSESIVEAAGQYQNMTVGGTGANGYLRFKTADTERMRIDSSGNLFVGTTTTYPGVSGLGGNIKGLMSEGGGSLFLSRVDSNPILYINRGGSDGDSVRFSKDAGATVGSISVTASSTAYNTSSDARLKDVTGSARGLEVINELNPVSYNWKADGQADEGLIAQEVLDIVPNAVSGSKEEMYQMDYSKLVVHLVAGMKEQQAQIEALQSEINLLKGE